MARTWSDMRDMMERLLVMETFGYPDYLTASADELITSRYADRPALRPVLDALLALAAVEDIDDAVTRYLERACAENL